MELKLKKLTQEDLDNISDYFADVIDNKINAAVDSPKEIINLDVQINVSYNDKTEELDVDVDMDIETDELSELTDEIVDALIEESYCTLDEYINDNFRE